MLACLSAALLGQEPAGGDLELRLYVIHKERRPVDLSQASAAITVRPEKRGAKTLSMTLVRPRDGADPGGRFQTHELGPGHFAELRVTAAPPAEAGKDAAPPAEEPPRNGPAPEAPRERTPTLDEWRRQHVLRGPYFRAVLRGDDAARPFSASVTVRMGERSFTTREFRYPLPDPEPPERVLGRLEESARKIAGHMEKAEFGKIPLVTVKMEDDLARLAGLDSRDPEVDVEYQRQWLLETVRKIDKASYTGNDDINALLKQVHFKLGQVRSALKGEAAPKPEPERKPK
jgi:hypothetical protein